MLKEHFAFFRKLEILIDIGMASLAYYGGYMLLGYVPILPVFLVIWVMLLYMLGMYESLRVKQISDILLIVWAAAFLGIGIFGSAAYLLNLANINRFFVFFVFLSAAILISIEKITVMIALRQIRKKGFNFRNILVVGTGARALEFINLINQRGEWGLKIIGLIDEDQALVGTNIGGYQVLGLLKDVADIVHANVVDEIVFFVPRSWLQRIEDIIAFCETEGIRVHVGINVFDLKFAKAKQTELENFLLLTFERAPIKLWQLFIKEIFDIVLSGILIVILTPLLIIVSIAIKMTSKGPVFYSQLRCGMNGRRFTLYKFRTMVENAEALLPQLMANNEMTGHAFKMQNDPRVTPIGRFLRKSSIDELPQLWNVLRRDMSLVGPRPPLPEEVKKYDNWQRRKLSMRPGITCLWQVQGRNKITDFNEWARLDLQYIDHWSIWTDVRILLKTVPIVLFGIGAK